MICRRELSENRKLFLYYDGGKYQFELRNYDHTTTKPILILPQWSKEK